MFWTGTSLPLAAEEGLVVSVWGDSERGRTSSASSSCSLASSKFILPDRPGEWKQAKNWWNFNDTRMPLQFSCWEANKKEEENESQGPCVSPTTKNLRELILFLLGGFFSFAAKLFQRCILQFFGWSILFDLRCNTWAIVKNCLLYS